MARFDPQRAAIGLSSPQRFLPSLPRGRRGLTDIEKEEEKETKWLSLARAWVWRVPAAIAWLAILRIPPVARFPIWAVVGIVIAAGLAYLQLRDKWWHGCLLFVFFFPFYFLAFPLIVIVAVVGSASNVVWEAGRRSNDPLPALFPYAITAAFLLAIAGEAGPPWINLA